MAYVKITNFAIKDSTNDVIRGTEHDDEYNAIEASFTAQPSATQTLTNKTIALGSNTVSGTTAQFNTALSDGDFATLAGSETLTNKALNGSLGATTPSTVVATHIDVNGTSSSTSTAITATTGASYNLTQNSGSSLYVGCDNSAGSAMTGTAYATAVWGVGAVPLIFGTNNTEKMRIDPSGNVGIGTTNPSGGTSSSTNIKLAIGGTSGGLAFNASNATGRIEAINGSFANLVYAAGSGTGTNPAHTWIVNSSTTAMTLDASGGLKTLNTIGVGNATPSTSGAGITFPATQSASTDANTLDDYEEGTWTPTVGNSTTPPTFTYTNRGGNYTKVGRLVTAWFYCNVNVTAAGVGTVGVNTSSLPFPPASNSLTGSLFSRGGFATNHPTGATVTKLVWNDINPSASNLAYFSGAIDLSSGGATSGMQTGIYAGQLIYEAST